MRARMVAGALALAVSVGMAGPAVAGDEENKAVIELVHLIVPRESYASMIDQMGTQMVAALQAQGKTLPPDAAGKLKRAVLDAMPYDDLVGWNAEIYSSRFTLAEIKDLTAFYRTPTGKKAARLLPEVMGEVGKKMGPIMMQRMPAAMKKQGLAP